MYLVHRPFKCSVSLRNAGPQIVYQGKSIRLIPLAFKNFNTKASAWWHKILASFSRVWAWGSVTKVSLLIHTVVTLTSDSLCITGYKTLLFQKNDKIKYIYVGFVYTFKSAIQMTKLKVYPVICPGFMGLNPFCRLNSLNRTVQCYPVNKWWPTWLLPMCIITTAVKVINSTYSSTTYSIADICINYDCWCKILATFIFH